MTTLKGCITSCLLMVILIFGLVFGCGLFHKEEPVALVSTSYPVKPGWVKKRAWEGGDFVSFTGISTYKGSETKAKEDAISDGVKFLLGYAGIKDERVLELFWSDIAPKIITASKRQEKGPYEVIVSDFYLEKYIIKQTKKPCYKGYVQLQFTLPKWLELRNYVRATTEQKYYQKFYER